MPKDTLEVKDCKKNGLSVILQSIQKSSNWTSIGLQFGSVCVAPRTEGPIQTLLGLGADPASEPSSRRPHLCAPRQIPSILLEPLVSLVLKAGDDRADVFGRKRSDKQTTVCGGGFFFGGRLFGVELGCLGGAFSVGHLPDLFTHVMFKSK